MPAFSYGERSRQCLQTCDERWHDIALLALKRSPVDIAIVYGWRGQVEQNVLVRSGASKAPWPTSKHNAMSLGEPASLAIDFGPFVEIEPGRWDIPWNDAPMFGFVAGVFFAAAAELGHRLRWGADWDQDRQTIDESFLDYGHLELID